MMENELKTKMKLWTENVYMSLALYLYQVADLEDSKADVAAVEKNATQVIECTYAAKLLRQIAQKLKESCDGKSV